MDVAGAGLYDSNMQRHRPRHIPNYDLYGEAGELPDILHCEAISSRAPLHDWNIRPHRHQRLHQFFLVRSGGGTVEIDGRAGPIEPPLLINVPPLAVHAFAFERGTEGWVITIPVEMLDTGTAPAVAAMIATARTVRAGKKLFELFERAAGEHAGAELGRAYALRAHVGLLAAHVARRIGALDPPRDGGGGGEKLRRFEALLERHFREHWTVARYAAELTVSPTHLNRLARAATGLAASRLIEARLVREARRSLAYTNLTIAQIAYELGFDDPAYFTRVFTRATGQPPSRYRRGLDRPYHGGAPQPPIGG